MDISKKLRKYHQMKLTVKDVLLRTLNTKKRYHPVILKTFSTDEISFIFNDFKGNLNAYEDEVKTILEFCIKQNFTSRRKIKKVCVFMFPIYTIGFYDCKHNIDLSVDIEKNKIMIDYYGKNLDFHRSITKNELLKFYKDVTC